MESEEHTYEWYRERLSRGQLTKMERADFQIILDKRLGEARDAMEEHRSVSFEVSRAFKATDPDFEEMKQSIVARQKEEKSE